MRTLIKYDLFYLIKTKKFIIFPAVVGITALLSPIVAMYLPQILSSLGSMDGIVIEIPDPTVMDAYRQYFSDMNETIFFVIVFFAINMFIRDKTKGHYPMIFSKPVSRSSYLISKLLTFTILILVSLLVGIIGFSFYTYVIFEEISIIKFLLSNILLITYFIFITSICLFYSVNNKSYLTALLASFGTYLGFAFLSIFNVGLLKYVPTKLTSHYESIITSNVDSEKLMITLFSTILFTVIFVYLSIRKFRNQESNK